MPRKKKLSPLEQEFSDKVKDAHAKINEQLEISKQAFYKAVEIADETGVPFETTITIWEKDRYIPESFTETREKFLQEFDPHVTITNSDSEDDDNLNVSFAESFAIDKLEDILDFQPINHGYDAPYLDGWQSDAWSSSSMFC